MGEEWNGYGRAVIRSMAEVLADVEEEQHAVLLETADWALGLGLTIGTMHPGRAARLLALIEGDDEARAEREADAADFLAEAFG